MLRITKLGSCVSTGALESYRAAVGRSQSVWLSRTVQWRALVWYADKVRDGLLELVKVQLSDPTAVVVIDETRL